MSRIQQLFQRKSKQVLNVYCTAGFPEISDTLKVMNSLQAHGADIIELGMPYSDPLADGPVIQRSGARALQNGMTISTLFNQLAGFRNEVHIPVVLMGYLNPLIQYGFEAFCRRASEVGIDGLIIPDIPMHEYETEYKAIVEKWGLDFIFLVTPETTDERIKKLDSLSTGFLYAVSSSSVTGSSKDFSPVAVYLQRLKNLDLRNPVLVGFGIRDRETFLLASRHSSGGIIGSAYVNALENATDIDSATREFIKSIIE